MNIIAVDDEHLALKNVERAIRGALPGCALSCFDAPSRAIQHAKSNRIEVAFLDVEMGGMDGLELAGRLKEIDGGINIVFVTGHSEYAADSYSIPASGYIMKPVSVKAILNSMKHLRNPVVKEDKSWMVSTPDETVKIPYSSLSCVENHKRAMCIHLTDGSKLYSKTFRGTFESAAAPLLKDGRFLHAHKSFVLNMEHVKKLTGSSFVMNDGMVIHIPRYKYADMKRKYFSYMAGLGCGVPDVC